MRELLGRDDAYIVPSGVDIELFQQIDRSEARQQVGWDVDGTYVLFPYSPEYERKNYPLAERVVNEVERELEREISLKTISGVPHDKMPLYINSADALLLTSRHEGSPNTVKEAMACNVPVVSTDVGDVEYRLSQTYPSGVGKSPRELIELLSSIILNDNNRSNGRDRISDISWNSIGDDILEIYIKVADIQQ